MNRHFHHIRTTALYETTFPDFSSSSSSLSPIEQNVATWKGSQKSNPSSLPWGPKQEWALRDNISKYTVALLPSPHTGGEQSGGQISIAKPEHPSKTENIVLWRTLLREVAELSGYDISIIQKQYHLLSKAYTEIHPTLSETVLPYLDQYEFQLHGGVSGVVYGLPGILDGTRIQTSSLIQSEYTISRGFIQTQEEYMAYELGEPFNPTNTGGNRIQKQVISIAASVFDKTSDRTVALEERSTLSPWVQPFTVTLVTLTGVAALVNVLSHHLTINVFWV